METKVSVLATNTTQRGTLPCLLSSVRQHRGCRQRGALPHNRGANEKSKHNPAEEAACLSRAKKILHKVLTAACNPPTMDIVNRYHIQIQFTKPQFCLGTCCPGFYFCDNTATQCCGEETPHKHTHPKVLYVDYNNFRENILPRPRVFVQWHETQKGAFRLYLRFYR